MSGKLESVTLGLTTIESLPEIQISPFIACKNYEETITTIHTCKIYYRYRRFLLFSTVMNTAEKRKRDCL